MPLPTPKTSRVHRHTRSIVAQAYERDDGLWDIDARISDIKPREVELESGIRALGEPIHDLWLRITIDTAFNITDTDAVSDAVPYPGYCDTIGPAYKKLIGLNLMKGFRLAVKERLAGTAGCTHLSELASMLPTAAIQAFAGDVFPTRNSDFKDAETQTPFQLDRCHALKLDGPAVEKYYPRWAIKKVVQS